ncbi:BBSome complex assembly protein BBS10 [Sphaeramia orbicularis]|uniref:BBSome complex assembly protein BBS10 n=1 Tax=Sphaeramia orbicularis TaxID=375764 RepID=UPI00117DD024|nr:Bardet-Biedl syndrome 10 protein [Sphaeramia orbicularis]
MMRPVEHLHLEHVLQTVGALEAVVLRSFGPHGGQVLFTRDTGQAMLSRSGTRILTALRLEHPLARMVVECVWRHNAKTGDGSKTFILLLASLLRMIHTAASKDPHVSLTHNSKEAAKAATARLLADKLLAFALDELDDLISVGVVPYGCVLSWKDFTAKTQSPVQKLLSSFFYTRLGQSNCDFISNLLCEMLTHWKFQHDPPSGSLQFINDNFPALHTPVLGFPISCSRLIEGQVIHRDFATPLTEPDGGSVKVVVFTGHLQPKLLNAGEVLELGCEALGEQENRGNGTSILHYSTFAEISLEYVFSNLQSLGVSVLLSAVKQSAAVLSLATQAEICVVECVSEDELSLFTQLSGATPVSEYWRIQPEHVATLAFCRPILLGAHRYVHAMFHNSKDSVMVKPCSLVICGSGEGQTEQYAAAFQEAIRMVLTTWEPLNTRPTTASKMVIHSHKSTSLHTGDTKPTYGFPCQNSVLEPGCVVPAGGTFEFLLNHALLQHISVCDNHESFPAASQLLANALLSVPRQIYSHSPRYFLQAQAMVLGSVQNHVHPCSLVCEQERGTRPIHGNCKGECPPEDGKLSKYCYGKPGLASEVVMLDSGLESVSCKYHLVLAVLQCVTRLFQIDTMLHTHTRLNTQSRRLANISWEDTEDEAEN